MTVHQSLRSRIAQDSSEAERSTSEPADEAIDPWQAAPVPAQVARRVINRVVRKDAPARHIPLLTQVMHWSYGIVWGSVYERGRELLPARPAAAGLVFGVGVWVASYAQLVAMGLYEPPWRYSPSELADDLGYHFTYGVGVALAHERLRRRDES